MRTVSRWALQMHSDDGSTAELRRWKYRPTKGQLQAALGDLSRPWQLVEVRIPAHALTEDACPVTQLAQLDTTRTSQPSARPRHAGFSRQPSNPPPPINTAV